MTYEEEILNTSLVLGIRNYLCFTAKFPCVNSRVMVIHAFVSAALEAPDNDPTAFVNDTDDAVTLQSLLVPLKDLNCKIPASYCTFAFSCSLTMKSEFEISEMIFSRFAQSRNLEEFDRECKESLRLSMAVYVRKLYELITTSIISLCKNPPNIEYQEIENWDCMENMKFFVLLLLGYWGRNSHSDIRDYAYSQLSKMRRHLQNVLEYNLCAFIFFLLCENAYLSVNSDGILDVSCQYTKPFDHKHLQPLPTKPPDFPTKDRNFNWVKFFDDRYIDKKFIDLFNDKSTSVRIVNFRDDVQQVNTNYEYHYKDFVSAIHALWDAITSVTTDNNHSRGEYNIKPFKNSQVYFPNYSDETHFLEMWITRRHEPLVSRCRFVYAYRHKSIKGSGVFRCEGLLFITYSHYGSDLLPKDVVVGMLKLKKVDEPEDLSYEEQVTKLKKCYNDDKSLQQGVINYCVNNNLHCFPFDEIGMLTFETQKNGDRTSSLESVDDYNILNHISAHAHN